MIDSGNYAARATAIRETAKWIAAVFAAAGAVLFSGLSFTNVTQAASTQDWELPVFLAAVPVLAAALAVWAAAWVILQAPPATDDLLPTLGPAGRAAATNDRKEVEALLPATVAIHGTLDAFEQRLNLIRQEVTQAQDAARADPIPAKLAEVSAKLQQLTELQDGVRDVVLCADYLRVKRRYNVARWIFLAAALIATGAAAWSGVEAGEADRAKADAAAKAQGPAPAQFSEPSRVQVFLTEAGKRAKVSLPCAVDGKSAIAVGGDYRRPLLVFEGASRCPEPFTWQPNANHVLVVPDVRSP